MLHTTIFKILFLFQAVFILYPIKSYSDAKIEKKQQKSSQKNPLKNKLLHPNTVLENDKLKKTVTVCSQNLANYGTLTAIKKRLPDFTQQDLDEKISDLLQRIETTQCDVIALQEILGTVEESHLALKTLTKKLHKTSFRPYDFLLGDTEEYSRVGFIYALDKFNKLHSTSYDGVAIPKIMEEDKPLSFVRAPLELQLQLNNNHIREPEDRFIINLITFHFKSKRSSWQDPSGLEFETTRMQMAEGLRRIVAHRHDPSQNNAITILLGDRNSNYDTASAKILEGKLLLNDFKRKGKCRLSFRGVPLCVKDTQTHGIYVSPLILDPEIKYLKGTFFYKNVGSFLDDILIPIKLLPLLRSDNKIMGDYNVGILDSFKKASDHSLIWVRFAI